MTPHHPSEFVLRVVISSFKVLKLPAHRLIMLKIVMSEACIYGALSFRGHMLHPFTCKSSQKILQCCDPNILGLAALLQPCSCGCQVRHPLLWSLLYPLNLNKYGLPLIPELLITFSPLRPFRLLQVSFGALPAMACCIILPNLHARVWV